MSSTRTRSSLVMRRAVKFVSVLLIVAAGFLSQVQFVSIPERMPPSLKSLLDPVHGASLRPLLSPRVPGTEGALAARAHIVSELQKFGWDVQIRPFVADTPIGDVPMANLLSRPHSLESVPKLTLAAHYDSKLRPENFVGAIDSAFPCSLLLYLASVSQRRKPRVPFDLIFFDGEEAFNEWTHEDSLYGARKLAPELEGEGKLPQTLVLLDLLGNEQRFPIPSWFPQTHHLFKQLASINPRLVGGRALHEYAGMMQDDHIPFLQRGVPVLHLIPPSFPEEWHTVDDNADLLHWETMEGWAEMLEEWLFGREDHA